MFAAALRHWHTVDHGASVQPWLFKIARNTVIDHHRAARRRQRLHAVLFRAQPSLPQADPQTTAELHDDLRRFISVMATLKRREQLLLGLRVAAGMPHT